MSTNAAATTFWSTGSPVVIAARAFAYAVAFATATYAMWFTKPVAAKHSNKRTARHLTKAQM